MVAKAADLAIALDTFNTIVRSLTLKPPDVQTDGSALHSVIQEILAMQAMSSPASMTAGWPKPLT